MADSCSFITNHGKYNDYICFRTLTGSKKIIVIEKEKQFYPIKKIIEYLEDLHSFGFDYSSYEIKERGDLHIDISNFNNIKTIQFGMLIRCCWEGLYTETVDNFYKIFDYYFKLKKNNKLKFSNLEKLLLAHTLFVSKADLYYNYNHLLCNVNGCIIHRRFNFEIRNINVYYSNKDKSSIDKIKLYKYLTNKRLMEIYNEFIQKS